MAWKKAFEVLVVVVVVGYTPSTQSRSDDASSIRSVDSSW